MSIPSDVVITYAGIWNSTVEYFQYYGVVSPIDNAFYVYVEYAPIVGGNDPSVQPNPVWVIIQSQPTGDITGVIAGTGLSGGGTSGTVTLTNDGVRTLTAGTGGVTITGTATDPIVNVPTIPSSTLVISDYTSTVASLALTGTFVAQGSTTLTTTEDSAPINVWGNLNVFHPTGGGGGAVVVEARLVIGTTPQQIGATVSTTVDNGHYATIPLIYKGTGSAVAGSVNILLQARVISGTVNRVSAQVMAIGQMLNA